MTLPPAATRLRAACSVAASAVVKMPLEGFRMAVMPTAGLALADAAIWDQPVLVVGWK